MAGELSTIARPYAEAVFERATETDKLDLWSEMLAFIAEVAKNQDLAEIINSPAIDRGVRTELLLDIAGGRLNDEGQNLLKLLMQNDRIQAVPEIAEMYESMKAAGEGAIDVHIVSAYALKAPQQKKLAEALKKKLGKDVHITSEKDHSIMGGVIIHAGDLVIDGSIRGQLQQLANELEI